MDFSDPQGGKDSCDRKAASIKSRIRIYVNEGNDIETTKQMKQAIESHGGLNGKAPFIISVPSNQEDAYKSKMKLGNEKISLLNNFMFTEGGLLVWRAYDIGPGRCISVPSPSIDRYIIKEGPVHPICFTGLMPRKGSLKKGDEQLLFACPEEGCILSFATILELEHHTSTQQHNRVTECETLLDKAALGYTKRLNQGDTRLPSQIQPSTEATIESASLSRPYLDKASLDMGWALKSLKKAVRFTEKQSKFLREKYQQGEETGRKYSAEDVAKEMRLAKDVNNVKIFNTTEYLSAKQISGFFPREAAQRRGMSAKPAEVEIIPDDDDLIYAVTQESTILMR